MSEATYIDDHVAQALGRLLQQYKQRPHFEALVTAFAQHVQQLEDAFFEVKGQRGFVDGSAAGAQLDAIGQIVGVQRNGLSDAQYLALLRGTVAQNAGDATLETLLTVARGLFQAQDVFVKTPMTGSAFCAQAAATLAVGVGDASVPKSVYPVVLVLLEAAIGGGVSLAYLTQFKSGGAFAFAGPQPWVRGFDSGVYADLLINNVAD